MSPGSRSPSLNSGHLLEYFGYVLLVLIGVELLDTIRAYLQEHVVHVEIVLEVALIAVARKIIILELKDVSTCRPFRDCCVGGCPGCGFLPGKTRPANGEENR